MIKINSYIRKNKDYSIVILRIGLALVLLWFGINQVFYPDNFLGYLPPWAMPHPINMIHFPPIHMMHDTSIQTTALIVSNGFYEIILGLVLLVGFYTRITAFIAGLHLLLIALSLGYNDIAIRDFGLSIMAFSLVFSGAGKYSLDNKKEKYINSKQRDNP